MVLHSYRLVLDEKILASLEESAVFLQKPGIIERLPDLRRVAAPFEGGFPKGDFNKGYLN